MCGISGFLTRDRSLSADALRRTVFAMGETLAHRGPDDCGEWVDTEAGMALAHRRLSIIDLSPLGHQPMASADGRFVIVYNGEIYNYRDLRIELTEWGYPFAGHSDTEVLLAGFVRWGVMATLQRSNGMFALAVWDRQERKLTLARDRVGKKPLYYGRCGNSIVFGSELKSIRIHPDFAGEIDRQGFRLYLNYGWVPSPFCIYRDLRKLPPGCLVTLTAGMNPLEIQPTPYWSAKEAIEKATAERFAGSFQEAVDHLEMLLADAVDRRMISDVPLGALLSGGIDSSCVVSLMQTRRDQPAKTFSIGVEAEVLDEARYAKAVAAHLGTDHHELYVSREDILRFIPSLPQIYDEPFADISQIPTCLVAELARRHVTVALSGDGGDEGFAGYTLYDQALDAWKSASRIPRGVRPLMGTAARGLQSIVWSALSSVPGIVKVPRRWHRRTSRLTPWASSLRAGSVAEMLLRLRMHDPFADAVPGDRDQGELSLDPYTKRAQVDSTVAEMLYTDFIGFLTDDILVKVDRASMAVGLEVRCPFLDHRVIEFAWSLPESFNKDGFGGKRVLRELLSRYLPRPLFERPKQGFSVPSEWFEAPLRALAGDLLTKQALKGQDYLDPDAVEHLCRQQRAGWEKLDSLVLHLAIFQAWRVAQQPSESTASRNPPIRALARMA